MTAAIERAAFAACYAERTCPIMHVACHGHLSVYLRPGQRSHVAANHITSHVVGYRFSPADSNFSPTNRTNQTAPSASDRMENPA